MLRRALGLTQEELGYLLGYDGHSQVARLEDGSKTPLFAEGLIMELVLGAPAVEVFPKARESARRQVLRRLHALRSRLANAESSNPRLPYKAAQLERVTESIRCRDTAEASEPLHWHTNKKIFNWVERYL